MGWNGSTLSRHLVTPAHVKTRRGATALGASGQTQSALPCRPGNSLVAQGEVPSIGNGTMRQVFFHCGKDFFFALLLIFPLWEAKEPARPSQEAGCHKICFYIDPTGLFFTCRTKKISGAPKPHRHSSPATGIPFCIREKTSGQPTPVCRTGPRPALPCKD